MNQETTGFIGSLRGRLSENGSYFTIFQHSRPGSVVVSIGESGDGLCVAGTVGTELCVTCVPVIVAVSGSRSSRTRDDSFPSEPHHLPRSSDKLARIRTVAALPK